MNRVLMFAALSLALVPAVAQETVYKRFTGTGGSGRPAVWYDLAEKATISAKYWACESARSNARKAGFTKELKINSSNIKSPSLNIPTPRFDERFGHKINNDAASCSIIFSRLVENAAQFHHADADDEFRQSVEQELLKALIPNFPSVKSVAIRAMMQQALRTGVGKQFLDIVRKFNPIQRQRAAYRAADKLEKTLRGITDPKLEDIERMLGMIANELSGVDIADFEQQSQKRTQPAKAQPAKAQPAKAQLHTFKMRNQGDAFLVTNGLSSEFFGEYVEISNYFQDRRVFVLKKNGRIKYHASAANWHPEYKWGALVKNGKIDWNTNCEERGEFRDKEAVQLILDGEQKVFIGCLYRNVELKTMNCGHVIKTSEIFGFYAKKC